MKAMRVNALLLSVVFFLSCHIDATPIEQDAGNDAMWLDIGGG